MQNPLVSIESILKRIYDLPHTHQARHFLVQRPAHLPSANSEQDGAVWVCEDDLGLQIGLYFSQATLSSLQAFPFWERSRWTHEQNKAFSVIAEELSHFHFLIHHLPLGRSVSHLELEFQGEIDKFLLSFAAKVDGTKSDSKLFDEVYQQIFEHFSLRPHLSDLERERYDQANRLAKNFIKAHLRMPLIQESITSLLPNLRRYYRLSFTEKVSMIASRRL